VTARRYTCRCLVSVSLWRSGQFWFSLFLPFSALDKVLDFRSAVAQAREEVPNKAVTDIGRTILLLRTTLFR
jgi:hypothetical protein